MSTHGILSYYGNTDEESSPLILVIGREPNSNKDIANHLEKYDFKEAPKCGFWSGSYALMSHTAGITTQQLKQISEQKNNSPIIYADSLPITIPMHWEDGKQVTDHRKWKMRDQVTTQQKIDHANAVLSVGPMIDRVAVVLFSGIDRSVFSESVNVFKAHFDSKNIAYGHFDQFSNMTAKTNKARLTPEVNDICRDIINDHQSPLPQAA